MRQDWRKLVAITFLVWVLADLLVPGVCNAEAVNAPDGIASAASVTAVTNSGPSPQRSAPTAEEDCFCCCSHVSPATVPAVVTLENTRRDWPPLQVEAPRELSFSLYHPPRS